MSETDADPWEGDCPFCGTSTGHLNNHIRPTDGNGHGPAGQYPDDWDRENREVIDPAADDYPENYGDDEQGDGETYTAEEVREHYEEEKALEVKSGDGGPRTYECEECNVEVEYGAEECENGHGQEWHQ